jgi:hypothetical protein
MARGWESKSVEAQQESREAPSGVSQPALTPEEAERHRRRRLVTLALASAEAELRRATAPAHRRMLEAGVATLRQQLETC